MGFSRLTRQRLIPFGALASASLCAVAVSAGDPVPADDPLLVSSEFVGGNGDEAPAAAVVGPDGALWIAATSTSTNFPDAARAPGADDETDVVVLRLDPATRRVISAAWLGGSLKETGSSADSAAALAFDAAGNAYLAGSTQSRDFPYTVDLRSAGDSTDSGNAFVARVLPDGSGFAWVALLGGRFFERATALCVTADGDPVVLGITDSDDFPTRDAAQPAFGGYWDLFVTRIRADGSGIVYSTYLGGGGPDYPGVVTAAPGGGLVVAGTTAGSNLGASHSVYGSAPDGFTYGSFLAEIDATGGGLRRSAFLGRTEISSIAFEAAGSLLLAGTAYEGDARIALAPHGVPGDDSGWGTGDALLLRLDATTWEIQRGALFGGSGAESQIALARGADGTLWMTGATNSADLPVPGAVRRRRTGYQGDAFAASFDPADFTLGFATYIGGTGTEWSERVAAGPDGSAWIVGATESLDLPVRDPATARGDFYDLFVTRVLHGDPDARPGTPDLIAFDPLAGTTARLRWTAGAGAPETGFFIERKDVGEFGRVAIVPAGTTEWTDESALPDRGYTYDVQAVNAAGASPPSREVRILTPGSLDLRIGDVRSRLDRRGTALDFRLEGTVSPLAVGANRPDLRSAGVWVSIYSSQGQASLLYVPPDDPGWRSSRRRQRWETPDVRLDFRPATGEFGLRLRGWAPLVPPGETVAVRVEAGRDAATSSATWRTIVRGGTGAGRLARGAKAP